MPDKPSTGTAAPKPVKEANSRPGRPAKPTRAEQKRARLEAAREQLAREQRRVRVRRLWLAAGVLATVVVLVLLGIYVLKPASTADGAAAIPTAPATTASGRDTAPPWGVPADASAAVAGAGLPMLSTEGTVLHIHAHLDVIVHGKPVTVPAGIGIDEAAGKISPLHTHDTTGVIHVESPTRAQFSLGQFFSEWRVSLTADQIGGLKANGTQQLKVYVNGKPYNGAPGSVILHAHDEIAVVYGTAAQQRNPPGTYPFAAGL